MKIILFVVAVALPITGWAQALTHELLAAKQNCDNHRTTSKTTSAMSAMGGGAAPKSPAVIPMPGRGYAPGYEYCTGIEQQVYNLMRPDRAAP